MNYLRLGIKELNDRNYVEAINYFTWYIKDHPDLFEGYYWRCIAKYNLDDLTGAEYDITHAINCLPQFPRLYLIRGVIRFESFSYVDAMDDFNTVSNLDSVSVDTYFYRALVQLNLHNYEDALNDANTVLQLDEDYTGVYMLRGTVNLQSKNYQGAISDFTKAIEKNPMNGRAFVDRGNAYAGLDDIESALIDIDSALAIDSMDAYAYFHRALLKMQILAYEEALVDLNRVIEISPENELAYFNRAIIKSNNQEEISALDDLYYILQKNPDNILVYYNLGISKFKIGDYLGAIESFNQAIRLFPEYAAAYQQRALAKKALGDKEGALLDITRYENLVRENEMKNDTVKFQQGMEILRLTHLFNDFISEADKKHKIQYLETEINPFPPFQVVIDSVFIFQDVKKKQPVFYILEPVELNSEAFINYRDEILNTVGKLDRMIKTDSINVDLYIKRGLYYLAVQLIPEAILNFTIAQSYQPENPMIYFLRANAHLAEMDQLATRASYNIVPPLNVNSDALRIYSGIIYDLNKALKLDTNFLHARYNLAFARLMMKDYQGALSELESVTGEKKLAEAHFNKALLQLFLNQNEEACIELSIAGELGIKKAYGVIRKYCN